MAINEPTFDTILLCSIVSDRNKFSYRLVYQQYTFTFCYLHNNPYSMSSILDNLKFQITK